MSSDLSSSVTGISLAIADTRYLSLADGGEVAGDVMIDGNLGVNSDLSVAGVLAVGAAVSFNPRVIAASGPVAVTDNYVVIDATAGSVTATLPAGDSHLGLTIIFKRYDSSGNTVTIARASTDTIDGATSVTLTALQFKKLTVIDTITNPIIAPSVTKWAVT